MNRKQFLIVGASRGIGYATTQRLATEGHEVWACARSRPANIDDASIRFFEFDVLSNALNSDELPDSLDGFVYCPGTITLKPIRTLKEEDFRGDWDLNFLGAVRCTKAVLPLLQKSASSSIVFFSTVAVQQGMSFHSSIAAAKGAIEGFTRSLAAELAPDVRVNCIAPSLTDTGLAARLLSNEQRRQDTAKRHPLQRYGLPADMAAITTFLLSDDASWITGQVIGVDGGLSHLRV